MCLGQASWDWWSDVTRKMIYSLVGWGGVAFGAPEGKGPRR